jgi:hypothetical protein
MKKEILNFVKKIIKKLLYILTVIIRFNMYSHIIQLGLLKKKIFKKYTLIVKKNEFLIIKIFIKYVIFCKNCYNKLVKKIEGLQLSEYFNFAFNISDSVYVMYKFTIIKEKRKKTSLIKNLKKVKRFYSNFNKINIVCLNYFKNNQILCIPILIKFKGE